MCLISKDSELKVATEDIVCWKVLYYGLHPDYETPFQHQKVPESVVCGEEPFVADENDSVVVGLRADGEFEYNAGVIHTYVLKYQANYWTYLSRNNVFECRIPKGTLYVEGVDTNGDRCFASKKIVFVQKVVSLKSKKN